MQSFLDLPLVAWWTAERISTLSNVTVAAIALVSLIVAFHSLRLSRQININANRPMMMAELLMPDYATEPLRLMVANRGKSVAKNVKVKFDPELPDTTELIKNGARSSEHSPAKRVKRIFNDKTFSTWVPGYQVDVAYWRQPNGKYIDDESIGDSAEGVPAMIFVVLDYDDELDNHYSERYELNVCTVLGTDFRVNKTTTDGKLDFEKQISKDLQENTHMLGRISRKL